MKSVLSQLATYKSVHLNKNNIKTHFLGIPLIIGAIALLLASFNYKVAVFTIEINLNLTLIIACSVLLYYFLLSYTLAFMSIVFFGPVIYASIYFANIEHNIATGLSLFVVGWILQFVGHFYEKAKPAFVDDLNQLAIGPLFFSC